jgi:hypothetical protein
MFTFFSSFFYSPPLHSTLSLAWPVFHSYSLCLYVVQWNFCLGIIPLHALCLGQCNPLHFLPLFPHPVLFNSFQSVSLYLVPIERDVLYFNIICYISFLLFLLSWSSLSHCWIHVVSLSLYMYTYIFLSIIYIYLYVLLVFVLGLYCTYEKKHVTFGFLNLVNFT